MSKRITTEDFVKRSKSIYGDKYGYTKTIYKSAKEEVTITCPIHGDFTVIPDNHIGKKRVECRICKTDELRKRFGFSFEKFVSFARDKFGEKFEYFEEGYKNYNTPIKIICPVHGEFTQTPMKHLSSKFGCRKCGSDNVWKVRQKIDTKTFKERAKKVHGNKYDYSLVKCNGTDSDVIIICPIHGKFTQNAKDHYDGKGCPSCKESQGEKKIRQYLSSNNISFISQKKFDDLKDYKLLSYDFYIPSKNLLIEYNGIQHYSIDCFNRSYKDFLLQKHHDWLKRKYARDKKINLLVIPYTKFGEIENELQKQLL